MASILRRKLRYVDTAAGVRIKSVKIPWSKDLRAREKVDTFIFDKRFTLLMTSKLMIKNYLLICVALLLAACGGGGSSATAPAGQVGTTFPATIPGPDAIDTAPPPSAASVEKLCEVPRPAGTINPLSGQPYGDGQGSLTLEKQWIRAYVNDTYLWYDEVPAINSAYFAIGNTVPYVEPSTNMSSTKKLLNNSDVVTTYFNAQRSHASTPSGKPKDPFHFTYPTDVWAALASSGASVGFGMDIALVAPSPPRQAIVAFTTPNSPATQAGIARGAQIVSVNGVEVANGSDVATLNEALFSPVVGKNYIFTLRDQGASGTRTVTLTAINTTSTPVQNVGVLPAPNTAVGYMLFNEHIATAEGQLVSAVNQLKAANGGAGITDLVLDLRYNGGGYLDIASELAYMIAGATSTSGKTFEKLTYNSKNPFGQTAAQATTPFHATTVGFGGTPANQPLPQLGLNQVFVLTGNGTCSASEAIMNGLRGAGIRVVQIGNTTCGKPYGFYAQDNCSTTYFTIQFKGVNNAGFGDYADGFIPAGTGTAANNLPGCVVADDYSHALGDPAEGRLAAALQFRANGSCPAPLPSAIRQAGVSGFFSGIGSDPRLYRTAFQENRFYRRPPR